VCAGQGGDAEGYDEEVLAAEGGYEGGFVVVVYWSFLDAWQESGLAVGAGDGCDGVVARFEEFFDEVFA